MTTAIIVGIFTLLGVLIGGVVNGLVAAALERQQAARRTMVTARLTRSDLNYIAAMIVTELEDGAWNRFATAAPPISFDSWEDRGVLAAGISDHDEWAEVEVAARQALRVMTVAPMNPKPAGTPMSQGEKANLETILPRLETARDVLTPYAAGKYVPSFFRALVASSPRTLKPSD